MTLGSLHVTVSSGQVKVREHFLRGCTIKTGGVEESEVDKDFGPEVLAYGGGDLLAKRYGVSLIAIRTQTAGGSIICRSLCQKWQE